MQATDFLLGDDGDLIMDSISGLTFGLSDNQHIELLFALEQGELKESPLTGIGVTRQVNGTFDGKFRKKCLMQLQADGYDENTLRLDFSGDNIDIYAQRKS